MANQAHRSANVYYNGRLAGVLSKAGNHYRFVYDPQYLASNGSRSISLTLPLNNNAYESPELFPVFINMLSEGANKRMQCRLLKIDENDYFSLLLATASQDSIGALTIEENK